MCLGRRSLVALGMTTFFLLSLTACTFVTGPLIFIPKKPPPLPNEPPPEVTVVLGSGGTKALVNVGVLKVLEAYHIPINMLVATNSASIVGVMYADYPNAAYLQNRLVNLNPVYLIDPSALHILESEVTGVELQNFIYSQIRAKYFRQLPIRFVAVATDLRNGQAIPLQSGPIAPAINAAAALPPYLRPVRLYGHILIDGNTTDPIPVDVAKQYNPKVIIAVNPVQALTPELPTNIVEIYDRTYAISNNMFNEFSAQDASIVVSPIVFADSATTPAQKRAFIQEGEEATKAALPQICSLLEKNGIASDCSRVAKKSKSWNERLSRLLNRFREPKARP